MLAAPNISNIPRAENRWIGSNSGRWVHLELDRLAEAFTTTLNQTERVQYVAEMAHTFTEELPAIPLHFNRSRCPTSRRWSIRKSRCRRPRSPGTYGNGNSAEG